VMVNTPIRYFLCCSVIHLGYSRLGYFLQPCKEVYFSLSFSYCLLDSKFNNCTSSSSEHHVEPLIDDMGNTDEVAPNVGNIQYMVELSWS